MGIENNFVGPKPTFEKDGITEVNIKAHINEARNYTLTHNPLDILQWFKGKVSNKGDWDHKQQDRKYADFKNMEENGTCDGCVACMGFCPQEAIEIY
nr:hypothetical protein [Campylobacter sp.]